MRWSDMGVGVVNMLEMVATDIPIDAQCRAPNVS